ncbi:MAG: DUF4159 domain-containing protein [Acidobacteria bacterium]|nr:DUF4159 domain-containing protein [Acidobacteriota bacterium]
MPSLIDHKTLRLIMGLLAIALPVTLAVFGFILCECIGIQDSISDYYSLRTRDALVGILFAIGWFLFAYRGYDVGDSIAGYLACLFALGVALFPNSSGDEWQRVVHFTSAVLLFVVLSYFALFLFTKSDKLPEDRSHQKRNRNRVYVVCGLVMLACIALIGLYYGLFEDNDPSKRMLAIINHNNDIGDAWEWADVEIYPREYANLAFQLGINYIIYAMTH